MTDGDDREMHFLSAVGDLCDQARIGDLKVLVETRDGGSYVGTPSARPVPDAHPDALDHTGYTDCIFIDGQKLALSDVYSIRFWCP